MLPQNPDSVRRTAGRCPPIGLSPAFRSKRHANLRGDLTPLWLRYCIATGENRAGVNDVNDVSGLSEPNGPDGAMAERSGICAALSQPGAPGCLRQIVRSSLRRTRADLAL